MRYLADVNKRIAEYYAGKTSSTKKKKRSTAEDRIASFYGGSTSDSEVDPLAPSQYFNLNGTEWKSSPQGKSFLQSLLEDKKKFELPVGDPVIDPYSQNRSSDPLGTPPPAYDKSKYPQGPAFPPETQAALLSMENGDKLMNDKNYKGQWSGKYEQARQLKEVGAPTDIAVKDIGAPNHLLGYMGVPGAAWMGGAKATRENNKGGKEVSDALTKWAKGRNNKTAAFLATNADNAINGLVGMMDRWGEVQNKILLGDSMSVNPDVKVEMDKNAAKSKRLEDTYGASEELDRMGWKRDGSFSRGAAGLVTDAIQDPTNVLGVGKAPTTRMAAREFAENATKESLETLAREGAKKAATEGAESLVKTAADDIIVGGEKATAKAIRRNAAKRGLTGTADAINDIVKAKPLTVADNASKVSGVDPAEFAREVAALSKRYGKDGAEVLAKDSNSLGKVDQKIVDIALRRSHEGFGAYGLDAPFIGETRNLPGSKAIGRAVSEVLEADINPIARWLGHSDDTMLSLADIGRGANPLKKVPYIGKLAGIGTALKNPLGDVQVENGRLAKEFLTQQVAQNAAAKRVATEMASHEANQAVKDARREATKLPKFLDEFPLVGPKKYQRTTALAQKYLPEATPSGGMLDEMLNGTPIDRAVVSAMNDPAAKGVAPDAIRRIMEDQLNMADAYAQRSRERLVPSNVREMYQPSRLPSDDRVRLNQNIQQMLYGKDAADSLTGAPRVIRGLMDETGALITGNRGFEPPVRGDSAADIDRALSQQNIRGIINNADSPYQMDKKFTNPAARGMAGKLTETDPYRAFEQVQSEQDILAAQEDLLYNLASRFGQRISPNAGEKALAEGSDLIVKTMDGTYYKMPNGDIAQQVNNLANTGNILGKTGGKFDAALSKIGSALNPLMTTLRPAFTAVNELGNLALMGRNGYGRDIPKAALLQAKLIRAGGDIDNVSDDVSRELLRQAQDTGVINALDLNPSTIFDPSHKSVWDRVPLVGQYNQWMKRTNALAENNSRLAVFLEEMAKNGNNPAAARQRVDDILFNYDVNALSPIEQEARKVAPFYTFTRRNSPATAEYYAKHPTRLANLERIRENFGGSENENQAELLAKQPPYLRDQIMYKDDDAKTLITGEDLGPSMVNVRLPDADALRGISILDRLAKGNTDEKLNAAMEIPRELWGPQYTMLNSLISNYDDRGNRLDEEGNGWSAANSFVSQLPMVGPLVGAVAKEEKDEYKGGDPKAIMRFLNNFVTGAPTTDYNEAAWERSNTAAEFGELVNREKALETNNPLESTLLRIPALANLLNVQEPIMVPDASQEMLAANNRIDELRRELTVENQQIGADNAVVGTGQSLSRQYRRWKADLQDRRPYARKDLVPPTDAEWEYLQTIDPQAYEYWRTEWKKKGGKSQLENRYDKYYLKTYGVTD